MAVYDPAAAPGPTFFISRHITKLRLLVVLSLALTYVPSPLNPILTIPQF